jgi:hypothetical protein
MIKLQLHHDQSSIFRCNRLQNTLLITFTNKKKLKHNHKEKEHSKLELVVKALNVISNVFCNRLHLKIDD